MSVQYLLPVAAPPTTRLYALKLERKSALQIGLFERVSRH